MIEIAGATPGTAAATPNAATNGATNGAARERGRAPVSPAEAPPIETGPLQRTALAVLRGEWTTLAIASADASAPAQPLAAALADVARAYRLRPVRAVDGASAAPALVAQLQDELASRGAEARLVVAVGDPRRNTAALPLLVHAEAVVIVVRLGVSELRAVEELVAMVGRERVLGCVVAR